MADYNFNFEFSESEIKLLIRVCDLRIAEIRGIPDVLKSEFDDLIVLSDYLKTYND